MSEKTKKTEKIESPTKTLEAMRLNRTEIAPNFQRESINRTILRLRDRGSKKFTCSRTTDEYFTIKRIQ